MGYDYKWSPRRTGSQDGTCRMPRVALSARNGIIYSGKCGGQFSWCEQKGYELLTQRDGKDPYSAEYAVCVDAGASKTVGLVSDLTGLDTASNKDFEFFDAGQAAEAGEMPPTGLSPQAPTSFDWRSYIGQNWITRSRTSRPVAAAGRSPRWVLPKRSITSWRIESNLELNLWNNTWCQIVIRAVIAAAAWPFML